MSRLKKGKGSKRSSTDRTIYRVGDAIYVSVFCDGSADGVSHEKWRIASLLPELHDERVVWHVNPTGYYDPESGRVLPISGQPSQWLVGDEWVDRKPSDRSVFHDEEFRVRWHFKCQRCRLQRNISTPGDYYEALTALASLGIREVELAHLIHARHTDA